MSVAGRSLCLAALCIAAAGCSRDESGQPAPATDDVTATTQSVAATAATAAATTDAGPDLDARVRQIASDWFGPAGIGGVVAVIGTPDGQVHVAAIGEAAPGVAATVDDVMRIGSITKTFTAAVILRLASRGLVDLDAPVAHYLPDLGVPTQVNVRRVLNHTSGITDPDANELIAAFAADPGHRYTPDELLALAHLPAGIDGDEFVYANANYHIAGLLIEQVSGRSFAEVLRDEVLDVAGLDHTYLVGFEDVPEPVVPGNADLDADGSEDSLAEIPYLAVDTYGWSAGAIATTPTDLVTFARALFDGTLLDHTAITELTDRTVTGEYTLGLVSIEQDAWGHNGGAPGYQAVFVHQPDRGVTAGLFTNCPSCAAGTPDTWQVITDLLTSVNA